MRRRRLAYGVAFSAVLVAGLWLAWPSEHPSEASEPPPAEAPQATREEPVEPADELPSELPPPPRVPAASATPVEAGDREPPPSPQAHLEVMVTSNEGPIPGAAITLTQDDDDDAAGEPSCPCTPDATIRVSAPDCGDCPELVPTILESVRQNRSFEALYTAQTDRDGRASFDLPDATPRLSAWVEASGYTPVSVGPFLPVSLHVAVTLDRPLRDGYRILGPDDRSLPHATAAAFSTHPYRAYAPRREGEVFWFEGVPSEYVLAATGGEPGLLPSVARAANRAHPDGGTVDDLKLESGIRLRARVTLDGHPVPSSPLDLVCNERRIGVSTDERGRFEVWPAPASGCDLLARCRGMIAHTLYTRDPLKSPPDLDLELALGPPSAVEGTVILEPGGVLLTSEPVALVNAGAPPREPDSIDPFQSVDTDDRGHFHFEDLESGDYDVLATTSGAIQRIHVEVGQRIAVTLKVAASDEFGP